MRSVEAALSSRYRVRLAVTCMWCVSWWQWSYQAHCWISARPHALPSFCSCLPQVPGLMLLLPVPPEPGSKSSAGMQISAQAYTGPLKYNSMAAWLREIATVLMSWTGAGVAQVVCVCARVQACMHAVCLVFWHAGQPAV